MAHQTKTVSLRLDEALWAQCKSLAKERKQSFNEFVETALQKSAQEERQRQLRAAFTRLSVAETDVEYAFAAQSEVVLDEDKPSRA